MTVVICSLLSIYVKTKATTKTVPLSQFDTVNYTINPIVDTYDGKGRQQEVLMCKFWADKKAWVAKCAAEYEIVNKQHNYQTAY